MTAYLHPTEELPLDNKHRWLAFADRPRKSIERITSTLRNLGLEVWNVQESRTPVGSDKVGYFGLIEATVAGVTPVKIAMRLGVNNLAIPLEPIPWSTELWVDAQELAGPSPVPVDFLQAGERLNPGAYYGVLATWFGAAPGMPEVSALVKAKGFGVLVDESMISATTGTNKFFYINTRDKNPSLRELQDAVGSDALYVNKHPFSSGKTLEDLGGAKLALEKGLRDFSSSVADASTAIIGMGSGAVDTIGTLSKVGTALLYALPMVLVGGLGYWGYTKYRESQNGI